MACNHLVELAEELIKAGIMTNAEQVERGDWHGNINTTRIFNCDETLNMIFLFQNNIWLFITPADNSCVCHNIVKSVCSKSSCKIDRKKPSMILPAAAISGNHKQNIVRKNEMESDQSSAELSEYEEANEGDVSDESEVSDD